MKKLFILSYISAYFFLFSSGGYPQQGWQWFNPFPSNKDIRDVKFVNETTGFASINYKIYKTTNSGQSWHVPGDTAVWYGFKFFDQSTGITLSTDGFYKTTNSGLNWNLVCLYGGSSGYSITGVDFVSLSTWYVIFVIFSPFGPYAHITYTTNSGLNWANPTYPEPIYYHGIKVLSSSNAYAVGVDSASIFLYKSYYPTAYWFRLPTGFNNSVTPSMFVKDSLTVFISAGYTKFTTDGGYSWRMSELGNIKDIKFLNSNTGIATGFNHQIFKTTNGGFNWQQITSPVNYDFNSISFAGNSIAYITGKLGSVLKSTDIGQTWSANCKHFTLQDLNDFRMLGKDTLIIIADSGYIFRSTNQGVNWQTYSVGNKKMLRKLFFIDKITGFAVGDSCFIIKTTNSGLNWNTLTNGFTGSAGMDIFFLNQNTGFICTAIPNGDIYKSTNGGNNWTQLPRPASGYYYFIRFINSSTGFTSCWEKIFKTTDLGNTWTQMNTDVNSSRHMDLCFVNSSTGFTAGGDGYIHKTTDGGYNWIRTTKLVYADVFKIKFLNEQTGYATAGWGFSGNISAIFSTTNGGGNWQKMYIPMGTSAEKLSAIDFCDMNTGFVVGDYGIVFKTTTGGFVFTKKIEETVPGEFILHQNYPNPFNPVTKIKYGLPKQSYVTLKIYDLLGREIKTLVNEKMNAGEYSVDFNASDLSSGIYFYKLTAGNYIETKKMILLK